MSRIAIFNVRVQAAPSSALAALAASMSANSWADFTMGNLTNATFFAESTSGTLAFLNGNSPRMTWDPLHKRIGMAGASHTGGSVLAGAGGYAWWDDATNGWSRETYAWSSEAPGHPYYHNTVNPANGDAFLRGYNSRTVYRRAFGTTGVASWAAFSTINAPNYANQVAGAIEFYPELNGGAGGMIFADELGGHYSNAAMSSWSDVGGASQSGIGTIHQFIARANGLVYYGGGNGSLKMWSVNASGVATARADTPIQCGGGTSFGQGAVFPHPNGTWLLAFAAFTGGNAYVYNGASWSSLGAHQIGVGDGVWAAVTIPEYGIVLFIRFPGASGTPTCKVYKA